MNFAWLNQHRLQNLRFTGSLFCWLNPPPTPDPHGEPRRGPAGDADQQVVVVCVNYSPTTAPLTLSIEGVRVGAFTPYITDATRNLQPNHPLAPGHPCARPPPHPLTPLRPASASSVEGQFPPCPGACV